MGTQLKDITWKHVVVIVAFLLLVAAMVSAQKDTVAIIAVGTGILAALGLIAVNVASNAKETGIVREQTNGKADRQLDMLEAQRREYMAMLDDQRRFFTVIIERQQIMIASLGPVSPEVLAIAAAPPSPVSPGRVPSPPPPADALPRTEAPGGYPTQYPGAADRAA